MQLSFIYVEYLKNYYYILCFFIKKIDVKNIIKEYIFYFSNHTSYAQCFIRNIYII